jgi:coproporphyrinogen III oxidase-like Fe-S oxidoreductase
MKSQARAFDAARASLRRLGVPEVLPALHAADIQIRRSVLGGSHSVPLYPPIDALTEVDSRGLIDTIDLGPTASLYVHIAFCETRCTFCHYSVEHFTGKGRGSEADDRRVSRYLDALKRELAFWGQRLASAGTPVSSIYVGGGTPLVLDQHALQDLLTTIDGHYDVLSDAEVCIEGSPLTITAPDGRDKLRFLKEWGFTRLSFGVQSFDDEVLKYAARGYKRETPMQAASMTSEVFDNWNLDLIQGLYKGSPLETWTNLEIISDIRPPHLTWYHGRFADRPQGHWYGMASKNADFEDEFATLLGRMLVWQEMAALGYDQTDGNRFVRAHRYRDTFKPIRTSTSGTLLGVGAGSYSHVQASPADPAARAYVFRNDPSVSGYVDAIEAGEMAIATGRVIDDEELFATSFATGLRNGRVEDELLRSIRMARPDLSSHYERLETRLRDVGILESYTDDSGRAGLRITELGRLFEDEALSLFFSPAVQTLLAQKGLASKTRHAWVPLAVTA